MPEAPYTYLKAPGNIELPVQVLETRPFYRGFDAKQLWRSNLADDPYLQVVNYKTHTYLVDRLVELVTGQKIMNLGDAQSLFGTEQLPASYTMGLKWQIAKSAGLPVPTNVYKVNETSLAFTDPTSFGQNTLLGHYESFSLLENYHIDNFYTRSQIRQIQAVDMSLVADRANEIADAATSAHLLINGEESVFDLVVAPHDTWSISMMGFPYIEDAGDRSIQSLHKFNRNKMLLFMSGIRTIQGFANNYH